MTHSSETTLAAPPASAITATGKTLLLSTLGAAAVAAIIVVGVILPAEYGIDPLRTGRLLGLDEMAAAKAVAANLGASGPMHEHERKFFTGRVEIAVKPREELEYKALLAAGEPMLYSWRVEGGPVYSEFHGEPTEGEWPEGFYQSYQIKESTPAEHGSFVAPFTGNHGWYWRNLSDQPVTIVLEASGYYTKLQRIGG
ncbi:hypothetical protein HNQ60_001714 [Povalibacter uvarum]|uniref:Transmembrane anchor protein n=1 Tax=Povalibacter uvarum TaxID=732238 RepID=A0A841HJ57_9GAMM|nr:hypothetical protein [Povalibacter uvarum]MBB6092836.1 hypothetical protein [Povalibacter uvarum]